MKEVKMKRIATMVLVLTVAALSACTIYSPAPGSDEFKVVPGYDYEAHKSDTPTSVPSNGIGTP
jgi:hypothetical protein